MGDCKGRVLGSPRESGSAASVRQLERPISATRETVLARLAEAAEVEHCLMCVYLYAAFSLKGPEELPAEEAALTAQWRGQILALAREEMVHLLLVNNLRTAIGGPAQFGRMNFPVPASYLPAYIQVRLAPFNRDTIQHLVWLERPAGSTEPMGKGFEPTQRYQRAVGDEGLLVGPDDDEIVDAILTAVAWRPMFFALMFGPDEPTGFKTGVLAGRILRPLLTPAGADALAALCADQPAT